MFTALVLTAALAGGHGGYPHFPGEHPGKADTVITMAAHSKLTITRQCPGKSQYWRKQGLLYPGEGIGWPYWDNHRTIEKWDINEPTGYVTFNGITFNNHTGYRQTVFGWC